MILLLGGASETSVLAEGIAEAGFSVLVSTATDIELHVGNHPRISRRSGPLDVQQMVDLVQRIGIRAFVDATHPYAVCASATAREASRLSNVPCFVFLRPPALRRDGRLHFARDHEEAARAACAPGKPVLLTIGTKNLLPYVREGKRTGCRIVARVLSTAESEETCRRAGLNEDSIIRGRGPFSVDENRTTIRRYGIGVLVTKDSGEVGGTPEKTEAARLEGCEAIVVERPPTPSANSHHKPGQLIAALVQSVPSRTLSKSGRDCSPNGFQCHPDRLTC